MHKKSIPEYALNLKYIKKQRTEVRCNFRNYSFTPPSATPAMMNFERQT